MNLEKAIKFADKKCKEDIKSGRKYYVMLDPEIWKIDHNDCFHVTIFPASDDFKIASFRYGLRRD